MESDYLEYCWLMGIGSREGFSGSRFYVKIEPNVQLLIKIIYFLKESQENWIYWIKEYQFFVSPSPPALQFSVIPYMVLVLEHIWGWDNAKKYLINKQRIIKKKGKNSLIFFLFYSWEQKVSYLAINFKLIWKNKKMIKADSWKLLKKNL